MSGIGNTPKLALGEMAMRIHGQLSHTITEVQISPNGIKRSYELVLQLDDLLSSYKTAMSFWTYDPKTKKVVRQSYWEKMEELKQKRDGLSFNSTGDFREWSDYFHEHLALLSSCFNVIGLAPAQYKAYTDDKAEEIEANPEWGNYGVEESESTNE